MCWTVDKNSKIQNFKNINVWYVKNFTNSDTNSNSNSNSDNNGDNNGDNDSNSIIDAINKLPRGFSPTDIMNQFCSIYNHNDNDNK